MRLIIKSELFENSIYQKKYSKDFLTDQIIENDIHIDTEYVSGFIKGLQLDGVFLSNTNINAPYGHCFEIINYFPVFILHFEFSGDYSYTSINEKKSLVEISDFQYNMVYLPNSNGILKCKGNPHRSLEIHFTLDRIKKIAGDDYTEVLKKVDSAVKNGEPYVFWKQSRPIPPDLEKTLEDIIACPLCGHLKKTYLQSKVTSLMVDLLIEANEKPNSTSKLVLVKSDVDSLHQVERHIKSNLNKALTIADLSVIAGFNESKLKRDFKEVYGSTIFKYITKLRMEKAIALVRHEGFTIAEAAYEVGYNNPQHFTKAFKRTLGYLPKMLKQVLLLWSTTEFGWYFL
ncbi:helix-turn-helix domain-containing protein [Galbibacter sp.]|jgi:AraC-like DNA-binding protein|uniref:helix-turn-helix domain-containing protein n=1 Tax=Galbibacter sp. TaxID=2918471 RepID=UPI003A924BEE